MNGAFFVDLYAYIPIIISCRESFVRPKGLKIKLCSGGKIQELFISVTAGGRARQ